MRSADLVILLFDASVPLSDDHRRLLDAWDGAVRVLNKIDLVNQPADVEAGSFHVSARTGKGVEELMNAIVGRLVPNAPPPGAGVPLNVDQVDVISEIRSPCLADDPGVALDRVRQCWRKPS